ncbi:hypothetical protein D6855_01350 [Butyrivibrio sp. CB08]|uniref:ribonuclease H-like domain-containing protein n=1 Tax=Butyrivibrio sp. CB08 TaxID=2364879 RepID=UPI000EA99036|nr:ribonuclease H-like domain-containing protein [Butyrivibrio sp. CB08]RKM62096.1 hypothetical protein D6855_01350 [Butyrivibrio sp. CB08]
MIRTNETIDRPRFEDIEILKKSFSCDEKDILFIDIETTGLSPKTADLYLIGAAYMAGSDWNIIQFMAESVAEEEQVLSAFSDFSRGFKKLVHFNGDRFDIPFLQAKYEKYGLSDPFVAMDSFDLYKTVKPYKSQLGLPDCKQKTIELYLGINREDKYDGGGLIPVYKQYVEKRDKENIELLLLHNFEDVKGMFGLLPMLYYDAFFSQFKNMPGISVRTDDDIDESRYSEGAGKLPVRAVKVSANRYRDYDGREKSEVFMKLRLPYELPSSLAGNIDGCYFKSDGAEATLRVPLFETELKYFYSNYKDYYYLPKEDMAIHKSLAEFVDKDFREKAKPENCYTKKAGQYLMEWDLCFAPFFKRDYEDKNFYFDLNENMKKSRFAMSLYASHVIAHILDS